MNSFYEYRLNAVDSEVTTDSTNEENLNIQIIKSISSDTYRLSRLNIKLLPLASKQIDTNLINFEFISFISNIPVKIEYGASSIEAVDNIILRNINKTTTGLITFTSLDTTQISNIDLVVIGEQ